MSPEGAPSTTTAPAPAAAGAHDTKAAATTTKSGTPRAISAQARVVAMLQAPEGVTLEAIMQATGWQAHTVRGFISGTARRKLGLNVESVRIEGKRTYRVAA